MRGNTNVGGFPIAQRGCYSRTALPSDYYRSRTINVSLFVPAGASHTGHPRHRSGVFGSALLRVVLAVNAAVTPLGAADPLPQLTARLDDGSLREGRLTGDSPESLALQDRESSAVVSLQRITDMQGSLTPRWLPVRGRPAHLHLLGSESVPVGGTELADDMLRLQPLGGETVSIPLAAVEVVRQPLGEIITRFHDAEKAQENPAREKSLSLPISQEHSWSGKSSFEVSAGHRQTLLSARDGAREGAVAIMYYDSAEVRPGAVWQLEFELDCAEGPLRLQVAPGCQSAEIEISITRGTADSRKETRVPRVPGWHSLRLLYTADRVVLLRDEQVLTSREQNLRGLRSVSLAADDVEDAGMRPLAWIDDLAVSRTVRRVPAPAGPAERDSLWLEGGDELFASVREWDSQTIRGRIGGQSRQFSWSDMMGVAFAARPGSPSPAVSGWISEIRLESQYGNMSGASSQIVGAIQSANGEDLVLDHPWLGRLRLRLEWISRIKPRYRGSLRALDPAPVHLGNDLHADWRTPLPVGTEHTWKFEYNSRQSTRRAFLRLAVVDLEPFGGTFARSGKHHAEMSQGALLTVVSLNGRQVSDLNRFLDRPATIATPRTIRVALPVELLQNGSNSLKLVQSASQVSPAEYDDCEISGVCLELEE